MKSKPRKCPICSDPYELQRIGQKTCPKPSCAIAFANQNPQFTQRANKAIEKAQRSAKTKERRVAKDKLKTRSEWLRDAQKAFNRYIRARDSYHGYTCICCDKPLQDAQVGGGFDCGHYRSVGSAPHLRFNPDNAHGQTKQCNRWGAGRAVDYRIGLIKRIGLERVEALEADQRVQKWAIEDLKDMEAEFKLKAKVFEHEVSKLYTS